MKVYRFMSLKECQKFTSGMDLVPYKNNFKARTTSKGFCFLGEKTMFISSYYGEDEQEVVFSAEECYQFLNGIVSDEILVEFEVDENLLQKTQGIYADPIYQEYGCDIVIDEYCVMSYNRDTFIPCRYAIQKSVYLNMFEWYNFN